MNILRRMDLAEVNRSNFIQALVVGLLEEIS